MALYLETGLYDPVQEATYGPGRLYMAPYGPGRLYMAPYGPVRLHVVQYGYM